MKKIFILAVVTFFILLLPSLVFAQVGMMGNTIASSSSYIEQQKTLDSVTNSLLRSQNVSSIDQLNCSKVSQDEFEKVGDAWMGVMAGSEQNHSAMEQRMGGEGSQTLKQAHIQMGESYLGCATVQQNNWIQMMYGRGGGGRMMGYGYGNMMNGTFGLGYPILGFILWIVFLADLILVGVWLWKKIQK